LFWFGQLPSKESTSSSFYRAHEKASLAFRLHNLKNRAIASSHDGKGGGVRVSFEGSFEEETTETWQKLATISTCARNQTQVTVAEGQTVTTRHLRTL
jgi:hypothetical protein